MVRTWPRIMNPKSPLARPLKVALIDGEVVLLGDGAVNFSMTLEAADIRASRLFAAEKGESAA